MPHKHKAGKGKDEEAFNLPPSINAKARPVGKTQEPSKHKRKATKDADDTPKAFARLMAFHKTGKGPQGLDDGLPKTSK
ncbi:hypothetical protein LTS18_008850, partial [Coniosporium uncinatum]